MFLKFHSRMPKSGVALYGEEYFLIPEDLFKEWVRYMATNLSLTWEQAESKIRCWFGEKRKERKIEQMVMGRTLASL